VVSGLRRVDRINDLQGRRPCPRVGPTLGVPLGEVKDPSSAPCHQTKPPNSARGSARGRGSAGAASRAASSAASRVDAGCRCSPRSRCAPGRRPDRLRRGRFDRRSARSTHRLRTCPSCGRRGVAPGGGPIALGTVAVSLAPPFLAKRRLRVRRGAFEECPSGDTLHTHTAAAVRRVAGPLARRRRATAPHRCQGAATPRLTLAVSTTEPSWESVEKLVSRASWAVPTVPAAAPGTRPRGFAGRGAQFWGTAVSVLAACTTSSMAATL